MLCLHPMVLSSKIILYQYMVLVTNLGEYLIPLVLLQKIHLNLQILYPTLMFYPTFQVNNLHPYLNHPHLHHNLLQVTLRIPIHMLVNLNCLIRLNLYPFMKNFCYYVAYYRNSHH